MATLLRYFLSSLFARLYSLPQYPVLWCKWLAEEFLRSAHSSGSLDDGPLHLPSSDSYPRVQLELVCEWAFFHPRTVPVCSTLCSDLALSQVFNTFPYVFLILFINNLLFQNKSINLCDEYRYMSLHCKTLCLGPKTMLFWYFY